MMELVSKLHSLFFSFKERARSSNEVYVSDLTACFRRAWFTIRFNAQPSPTAPWSPENSFTTH